MVRIMNRLLLKLSYYRTELSRHLRASSIYNALFNLYNVFAFGEVSQIDKAPVQLVFENLKS